MKKADRWDLLEKFRQKLGDFTVPGMEGLLGYLGNEVGSRMPESFGIILKSIPSANYNTVDKRNAEAAIVNIAIQNLYLELADLNWLPQCFKEMAASSIELLMRCGCTTEEIRGLTADLKNKYHLHYAMSVFSATNAADHIIECGWTPVIMLKGITRNIIQNCKFPYMDAVLSNSDIKHFINTKNDDKFNESWLALMPDKKTNPNHTNHYTFLSYLEKLSIKTDRGESTELASTFLAFTHYIKENFNNPELDTSKFPILLIN